MTSRITTFILIIAVVVCSCGKGDDNDAKGEYVASFGNDKLYKDDLVKAISPYENIKDSAALAEDYIDNWLTERVIYNEAIRLITDTAELEERIMQYRRHLYVQEYLEKYLYTNVNMTITDKEVTEYYNKHLSEYVLNTSYIKAHYMTIPSKLAKYYDIFETLRKSDLNSEKELGDYCAVPDRNVYFVKNWLELDDFLKLINYNGTINPQELRYKNTLDYTYDTLRYLVKFDEYTLPGAQMPLELAKPQIIQIIMNKRRHDKYIQGKNELVNKYKSNGTITIRNQ